MRQRIRSLVWAAALLLSAPLVLAQGAQKWPAAPVKLVVPYPAGGLTDIVSRIVGVEVGKVLQTPVVIENKAGASGQIGLESVRRAPKDGYTVGLVVPATMVTLPLTNPNYKIRPLDDFEPITIAVDTYLTLVVDRKRQVHTLRDFLAYAKKRPHLNYGVPGLGTSFHFNNAMLANRLGIQATAVPYQGEIQVLNEIVSGQLDYALVSNAGKSFVESGQVSAVAVTADKRVSSLPNVPTFKELGVDFSSDGWVGYVVAKGTPPEIVTRLQQAFGEALQHPAVRQRLTDMGYTVVASSPEQLRQRVLESTKKYSELLKSGAVKME